MWMMMDKMIRNLTYSRNQIIKIPHIIFMNTIKNTHQYHKFIPWCKHSQIIHQISSSQNYTKLTITFNNLKEISYTSHVRIQQKEDQCRITSICNDDPLKYLKSVWTITKISQNSSKIQYFLDFEFDSLIYQLTSSIFLNIMGRSMWQIFHQRAHLYSNIQPPMVEKQVERQQGQLSEVSIDSHANLVKYMSNRKILGQIIDQNPSLKIAIQKIHDRLVNTNNYESKMNFEIRNILVHFNINLTADLLNELS